MRCLWKSDAIGGGSGFFGLRAHCYTYFCEKSRALVLGQCIGIVYYYGMDQETLIVVLFFIFLLGAGIGFYVATLVF